MAFPNETISQFPINLFHLLRNKYPNENILISPLNISTALHLLYSAGKTTTWQTLMSPSSNKDDKHICSGSKQYSKTSTCCNVSEASQTELFKQESHEEEETLDMSNDECSVSPQTSEKAIEESEDKKANRALEGLHKTVTEKCGASEANESPPVPNALPAYKRDAGPLVSNQAHVFTPDVLQSNSDEGIPPTFLPGSKDTPKHETVKVLNDKVMFFEREMLQHPSSDPEDQNKPFTQGSLVAEDIKLPFVCSTNNVACNASFQSSKGTINHMVCGDPEAKLGNSSLVFNPSSEVDNREPMIEDHCIEDRTDNCPQSPAKDIVLHLIRTDNDEVLLNQDKPFLAGATYQNQSTKTKGIQEGLSLNESVNVSDTHSTLFVPLNEATVDNVQKTPVQEVSYNINPTKKKDSGTERAVSFPCASVSAEINDRRMCMNLIQIPENSLRFESNEDISSGFLPWSEDFPRKEENEPPFPEDDVLHDRTTPENPQKESFCNHKDTLNISCSSVVAGAARTTHKDDTLVEEFECTKDQKKSPGEGVTYVALLSNDGLNMDRQLQSSWDYKVKHWLNQSVFELPYSSYDLPWNKYLIGREQREALIQSRYALQQSRLEGLKALLENSLSSRHTWMQNLPLAPRLMVPSYTSLLRSYFR